jgi:two-component system CheB/CheR fusion protein
MDEAPLDHPAVASAKADELRGMNEALRSVNAELQAKLERICSAHNELQNLIAVTQIGTLLLDTDLRIRMFTQPAVGLFHISDADVGRVITDCPHLLAYDGMERDAERALRELMPIEIVVESKEGRSYLMRVRPYRTAANRVEGVVISFVDISVRLGTEQQLRESEQKYHMLFDAIDEGFCIIELIFDERSHPIDYRFIDVNAAFERQTGLHDAVGKTMRSLVPEHEQ